MPEMPPCDRIFAAAMPAMARASAQRAASSDTAAVRARREQRGTPYAIHAADADERYGASVAAAAGAPRHTLRHALFAVDAIVASAMAPRAREDARSSAVARLVTEGAVAYSGRPIRVAVQRCGCHGALRCPYRRHRHTLPGRRYAKRLPTFTPSQPASTGSPVHGGRHCMAPIAE